MKVVQINATCSKGSTGMICMEISRLLTQNDIENYVFYAVGESDYRASVRYADACDIRSAAARSHLTGRYGFTAKGITRELIRLLDGVCPDIVHLHNLHSHNCHLSLLTDYLKEKKIRVLWTFHDCWAFTGYCPHFTMLGCERWKTGCERCPQYRHFSLLFDRSRSLYEKKKALMQGLDLTIATPSAWLSDRVKESFLKNCPVRVIHNGVDLNVFRPLSSDIRERYGIAPDKIMLLGIAYDWSERKGIGVFSRLAEQLDRDRYQIVLVGVDDPSGFGLPDRVITLPRIGDAQELARLYSAADIFLNPTKEDTFPTVNMEAIACGTPVVTFDVGGCAETVGEGIGLTVPVGDTVGMLRAIKTIESSALFTVDMCRAFAKEHFDKAKAYQSYLSCYEEMFAAD